MACERNSYADTRLREDGQEKVPHSRETSVGHGTMADCIPGACGD